VRGGSTPPPPHQLMIIYLDQNHIINLSKDESKLEEIEKIIKKRKGYLGISFAHVLDTINANQDGREAIIKVIDKIGYVELTHFLNIIEQEVINEFFRWLKLSNKVEEIPKVSSIFPQSFPYKGFAEIVRFASLDEHAKEILQYKMNYATKLKDLLSDRKKEFVQENLKKERSISLDYFIKKALTTKRINLNIYIRPKSLDAQDFKKHFSWEKSPYLNFYVLFNTLLYRDTKRDAKHDLSDLEHATLGVLSSDILCIEGNAFEIISQIKRKGLKIKVEVCKNINDVIRYLN